MDTTINHVQNALMRDRLCAFYDIDRGRQGYAAIWPISMQMMESTRQTLNNVLLYGVDDDGNVNMPNGFSDGGR